MGDQSAAQQRRHRATGADQLLVGPRHLDLFSNLTVPDQFAVSAALSRIVAAGPHTRVGLHPEAGKRLWRYDATAPVPVHRLPNAIVRRGPEAILEFIRRRPGDRRPLEVHVSERHVALDADHGLGDGRFTLDLISAIFAITQSRECAWLTSNETTLALPRALLHTFGVHPNRARQAWHYANEIRTARSARRRAFIAEEGVQWSPSFAVSVARVDASSEAAVDEWRRSNAAAVGNAALWLYITRRALDVAGLPMKNTVKVAFNCRRYLRKNQRVNGNFMIGPDLPLAVGESLESVASRLRGYTASATPLAGVVAVSALNLLGAEHNKPPAFRREINPAATVMHSDMGHIKELDNLPWCGRQSYTGLLDPATPEGITVYNARIGDARNISISFHDNVFDRAVIERAAKHLQDPMQFLSTRATATV